jgi:hypothetical protein
MLAGLVALALLVQPAPGAGSVPDYGEPYRILVQANLALDPDLAASAYGRDAKLIFEYPGIPVETFSGHQAIRASYVRTFGQVDKESKIALQFRFDGEGLTTDQQTGVYRIGAVAGGKTITLYGRFAVKLVMDGSGWRFAEDRGGPATEADFDKLPPASLERE